MSDGREIIALVAQRQDCEQFRRKNWVGTFAEYLDIVREHPEVTRTAYQRLYDMILSYGVDVTETGREKHTHYRFFDDPDNDGRDAVFGLDGPLHHLVNALKSAAAGYGIERRVLLLHGPVGSSKSTIVRLLKKGLERYSATDDGALYTLGWVDEDDPDECRRHPLVPDERGAAAPLPAAVPTRRRSASSTRAAARTRSASTSTASSIRSAASCTTSG